MLATLDERDQAILRARARRYELREGPRVGDYVRFADDALRRVSHVWELAPEPDSIQTSDGGSWYLGMSGTEAYGSFSGSLYSGVPSDSLTLTDERLPGRFWFFHHDHWTAHNGVDVEIPCRVYECDRPAAR
jgi:hypothetical protein